MKVTIEIVADKETSQHTQFEFVVLAVNNINDHPLIELERNKIEVTDANYPDMKAIVTIESD